MAPSLPLSRAAGADEPPERLLPLPDLPEPSGWPDLLSLSRLSQLPCVSRLSPPDKLTTLARGVPSGRVIETV